MRIDERYADPAFRAQRRLALSREARAKAGELTGPVVAATLASARDDLRFAVEIYARSVGTPTREALIAFGFKEAELDMIAELIEP